MNAIAVIPDGNVITIKCRPHLHRNAPPHHITSKLKCHDQRSSPTRVKNHAYKNGRDVTITYQPKGNNCSYTVQLMTSDNEPIGFPIKGRLSGPCKWISPQYKASA